MCISTTGVSAAGTPADPDASRRPGHLGGVNVTSEGVVPQPVRSSSSSAASSVPDTRNSVAADSRNERAPVASEPPSVPVGGWFGFSVGQIGWAG